MTSVVSYWLGMTSSLAHWLRTKPIALLAIYLRYHLDGWVDKLQFNRKHFSLKSSVPIQPHEVITSKWNKL